MIIYLTAITRNARPAGAGRDATIPEDQRGGALPLFCLAPHGVFRASRITPRAVSSYLAFSTLPELRCQRTGGVFSVTLSVNLGLGRGCPRVLRGMLPYGVRTFLSGLLRSDHLPSQGGYHILGNPERASPKRGLRQDSNGRRHGEQEPGDHRQGDDQFRDDAGQIAEHCPPTRAAGADETFARD